MSKQQDFKRAAHKAVQPPHRMGKRMIAAHVDAETFIAFKTLAAQEDSSVLALMCEGLELLFKKGSGHESALSVRFVRT